AALSLPKGKRMLGLDLGTKTIGMATSDFPGQFATPRDTIRSTRQFLRAT
ncbi:MAG: Holliday junction resolvase RuvX, partial [Zoogloea sp.]|nr:Holliday junction resolvase RuvX [Zoogloea sp.]